MPEDNGGTEAFLGTERMIQAQDLLERFQQLNFQDVISIIMSGVWDQRQKLLLLEMINEARRIGIKAPWQITGLLTRLQAGIPDSFHMADRTGGLTGAASMVFDRHNGGMQWQVLEDGPHILASNFREGQMGWISGNLGTGKTATGVSILEQWIDMGNRGLSNIKTSEKESYDYVQDVREMLLQIASILDDPIPEYWLMVFDELYGSGWSTAQASTSKDKQLDGFVRCIRKLGGNLIVIDQLDKKVPTTIQELASSRYFCHRVGGGVLTVDLRGPYRYFQAKIEKFPLPSIDFETKAFAFFPTTEIIDFEKLYQLLTKCSGTDGYPKAIRTFLKA